jgi:hypothetical protein
MISRRLLLAGAGLGLLREAGAAEPDSVVYPRHEALQDMQIGYIQRLMHAALARCGRPYQTRQAPTLMVQSRALLELARPEPTIDVFWTMSNAERERKLLPVRIPIERGLIGWRIALVRRADLERWKDVRRLDQLAAYNAGQMHDWPDTEILRTNGLPVQTSTHFQGLFSMLALGRIDYFPRSLLEIAAERDEHQHMKLEIEPHLLLHYPAALYFFVAPSRPRLAEDLSRGLERMQADGSFEQMFRKQFDGVLDRLNLGKRRVLQLRNPVLPADTPLQRKELWWVPKL